MSDPVTTATTPAPAVPAEILAWADGQDFRDAVKRAIGSLRRRPPTARTGHTPLWHAVSELLAVGSTYASRYCVLFGFDPDEKVRPPK